VLNDVMLNIVPVCVIMQNGGVISAIIPNVVILNAVILNVVMLSFICAE
jgi:hypothetical protein